MVYYHEQKLIAFVSQEWEHAFPGLVHVLALVVINEIKRSKTAVTAVILTYCKAKKQRTTIDHWNEVCCDL